MIKRMATCSVSEGIDPDEFWDYHHSVHAQDILRHGGEREFYKYSMSRVTEIFRGIPGFYDITEYWYEDQKAVDSLNHMWKEALASNGKDVASDFDSRVKENCSFIVEQVVVKDDSPKIEARLQMNNLFKLAIAWNTKDATDINRFWEYVANDHTAHILNLKGSGIRKYVVSRVSEVVVGKENQRFDGLVEVYWSNETDIDESERTISKAKLNTVETILSELDKWISITSVFAMQEFVGKDFRP